MRTVIDIAQATQSGQVTVTSVVQDCLRAIVQKQSLNAVTYVAQREALAAAASLDQLAPEMRKGRLFGVPILVKDAICTRGIPSTSGSRILNRVTSDGLLPYRPPYDATVIERLQAEGAIVLGKANMDEFAMGSSNETSFYGPVRNPLDETRVPGGSSGGSASAVAAGLSPAALGSDTGGSIRQPASFCGIVGVKPTFGRVSRYGLIAFASSLDQIGPMTPDVQSSARLLEIMSGPDGRDSTAHSEPVGNYEAATRGGLSGLRFGVPSEYFAEGLDPKVRAVMDAMLDKLKKAGAQVLPVSLPHTHYGVATYYVLATAEASSNLARFDGVRFGLRAEKPGGNLNDLYTESRGRGFGPEVQRRILLGTYVLSSGFYDAYYSKAQKVRTLIARDFERAFDAVDCIVAPTSPTVAFRLGERSQDPLAMYMADVYTLPASLAGVPALSLPIGYAEDAGATLPVGMQVIAPLHGEVTMFRAAGAIEELARG
jgi:aspartyl-tRNA(Asn)/glutamyl-tRNA(Gln) amidotransferase subunit A